MKKILMFALAAIILSACSKDQKRANITLKMIDAPAEYESVLVDVQSVEIHTGAEGWQTMQTNAGVFDLLKLVNGAEVTIGSGSIPEGRISQMRLILGSNNSVVIDGQTHSLATPSGQQSGIKINIHRELLSGEDAIIYLDFDAARSIVESGNGNYHLKPVIHAFLETEMGAIRGNLSPVPASAVVYAIQGTDTFSTFAADNGYFFIRGLSPGTYDVEVQPSQPYIDTSIPGVSVTAGNTTDIGVVDLDE